MDGVVDRGKASGGFWLEKSSVEYDQISYFLHASIIGCGNVSNLEIWKIENLELNFLFERNSSTKLKVPCWYNPTSSVDKSNTLASICTQGYAVESGLGNGLLFETGTVDLTFHRGAGAEFMDVSLIFTEVAIGRSFIYDGELESASIPVGYDSLYITDEALDRNHDGRFSLQEYQTVANFDGRDASSYVHRYYIKDPMQANPKYVARFRITFHRDGSPGLLSSLHSPRKGESALRNNNSGNSGITAEGNESLHYNSATLTPLGNLASKPAQQQGRRLSPPSLALRERDLDLNNDVDVDLHGNDSGNGKGRHAVSINQAFKQAVDDIRNNRDSLHEGKSEWINRQLSTLDNKVRAINLNYAEISEAIEEERNRAIAQLQSITRKKLEVLLGVEVELRRQREQVRWIDTVMERMLKSVLAAEKDPNVSNLDKYDLKVQFMQFWKSHSFYRTSLLRSKPTEVQLLSAMNGDVRVSANIEFYQDSFYAASSGGSSGVAHSGNLDVMDVLGSDGAYLTHSSASNPHHPSRAAANNNSNSTYNSNHEHLNHSGFGNRDGGRTSIAIDADVGPAAEQECILAPGVQDLVDREMSEIQAAILKCIAFGSGSSSSGSGNGAMCAAGGGMGSYPAPVSSVHRLPSSIVRPTLSGEHYRVPLHEILAGVDESFGSTVDSAHISADGTSQSPESSLALESKVAFQSSLLESMGGDLAGEFDPEKVLDGSASSAGVADGEGSLAHKNPSPLHSPGQRISGAGGGGGASVGGASGTVFTFDTSISGNNSISPSLLGSPNRTDPFLAGATSTVEEAGGRAGGGSLARGGGAQTIGHAPNSPSPFSFPDNPATPAGAGATLDFPVGNPPLSAIQQGRAVQKIVAQPLKNNNHQQPLLPSAPARKPFRTRRERNGMVSTDLERDEKADGDDRKDDEEDEDEDQDDEEDGPPIDYDVSMEISRLFELTARYPNYALELFAARKMKQLRARAGEGGGARGPESALGLRSLQKSKVLSEDEAEKVFFSLPFFADPPVCKLLYSTVIHERRLSELYNKSIKHRGPVLLVVSSGSFRFGAYLSHPIAPTSAWVGSPACFLFSATLGLKLPYHARTIAHEDGVFTNPLAVYATKETLYVGNGDLVLQEALDVGSSELENCYGMGLEERSKQALCLLAGRPLFAIDDVELWSVSSVAGGNSSAGPPSPTR